MQPVIATGSSLLHRHSLAEQSDAEQRLDAKRLSGRHMEVVTCALREGDCAAGVRTMNRTNGPFNYVLKMMVENDG